MGRWLPQRQLRWRPLWLIIGWVLVGVVIWLSLAPRLPDLDMPIEYVDKAGHFLAYCTLMLWFAFLYLRAAHIWIALALVLLGVGLEVAQDVSGYRMFEIADIVADAAGIAAGLLLARTPLGGMLERFERRVA